jgi:hypothetical protein
MAKVEWRPRMEADGAIQRHHPESTKFFSVV